MGCTVVKDSLPPSTKRRTPLEGVIQDGNPCVAEEFAECVVCFEPLCSHRCAVLMRGGARTCRHLMHQRCAEAMQCAGRYNCPECRAQFDSVQPLPSLHTGNIREWFAAVDVDGDGRLSKTEVLTVLKAQYRLDWRALEAHIDELWATWDKDASGFLAFDELTAPGGLVHYVTGGHVTSTFAPPPQRASPGLHDTAEWFKYWDEDGNGSLDQQEVQRALTKTFDLGNDLQAVQTMRETLEAVWPLYDFDGNGDIDFQEFTMPGGLGETLAISVESLKLQQPRSLMTRLGG